MSNFKLEALKKRIHTNADIAEGVGKFSNEKAKGEVDLVLKTLMSVEVIIDELINTDMGSE